MSEVYSQNSTEFLLAYAETLKQCEGDIAKANSMWERRSIGDWFSCSLYACRLFSNDFPSGEFRLKPKTITINGIELPEPMREPPLKLGDLYYSLGAARVLKEIWENTEEELFMLKAGRIFKTFDDANQVFKALTKVLTGVE